jgi:poly-gamma-glutamate synthesis protein (capsule biosynthesis protein)
VVKLLLFLQFVFGNLFVPQEDTLKIVFAGDIMQHKEQLTAALRKKSYDYSSYFKHLTPVLMECDIRAANMETTFSPGNFSGYPAFTSPASLLESALNGGFNFFFTANNHICDKNKSGLEYTINLYEKNKVNYTGISRQRDSEINQTSSILNLKGFKIALLNYTYGTNGNRVPAGYRVNILDSIKIERDIKNVQSLNPDIIIASVHWGSEYLINHSPAQEKWKRLFNRLGVKYIIGSHPHVPQEIYYETDETGFVTEYTVYSLGNCISNMSAPNTRIGLLVKLSFVKREGKVKLLKPHSEYIWTARPGEIEKNYCVIPVNNFKDKPEFFKNRSAYNSMMNYYLRFSNDR